LLFVTYLINLTALSGWLKKKACCKDPYRFTR
jgi:hypothetical protein